MVNIIFILNTFFIIIFLWFFLWLIIIYILSIKNSIFYKVPQVSTFSSDFKIMKKYLWKYNIKWKKIIDLWSWSWKTLRFFEREFSMKIIWYEVDFWNFLISKIFNKLLWYNAKIYKKNYLKTKIEKSDFIYLYLFWVLMKDVEIKIWKEAEPWTIVISNAFKLVKHKPIDILFDKNWKEEVYIYEV